MSKHDKDYDSCMLRFCGNMIASQDWRDFSDAQADLAIERALRIARKVRKELRKEQTDGK